MDIALFEKNIKFLYDNLPHYYNLVKNIKTRNYKILNNNIVDSNGNKFYPVSIDEDSQKFAYYPTHNELWERKFYVLKPHTWEKEFHVTGKIANKMINKAKTIKDYTEEGFYFDRDFLPTVAVFGILSGKHIDLLVDKYEFQSLFVYEPNPEFFAISLYFTDYEKIYEKLKDRFFLWINGRLDFFAIEKFYYERKVTSSFLTLTLKTYNHPLIDDAVSKLEQVRAQKLRGWGTYEDEKKGVVNHLKNINKYKVLVRKKNMNVPVCIVANGKSLEKNIEFIKKNLNSMIIISVGTAIKPLLKAGIESDFHIEQERIDILKDVLKDILPKYKGYFIGSNVVNEEVFKMPKKPLMYFRDAFALSPKNYQVPGSSPIVGNAGFAIASFFTKKIYLCGMDLGYRIGERKHASGSFYDSKEDKIHSGIKVEGNFSDDIYTDSLFLSSKTNIEKMIEIENLEVFNLSDGAYIRGSIPLKENIDLPCIDKERYINEMLECFEYVKNDNANTHPMIKSIKKAAGCEVVDIDNIDFYPLLKSVKNILSKKAEDYKHLTGLIDFIDNAFDTYEKKYPVEYSLLRGSLSHLLNYLYILSHKVRKKDIYKLQQILKKELVRFEKDFKSMRTDKEFR